MATTLQLLVEERLESSLSSWVRRKKALGLSYRAMSDELEAATGVRVSKSTLHLWVSSNI